MVYHWSCFYSTQLRPDNINNSDISLNTTRRIFINEIFPEQDLVQGQSTIQPTLDLAYFPQEKGPYNNQDNQAFAQQNEQNWGGIMRSINATNFEQSNVEFIEFWLLDTFNELESSNDALGELVVHLGNISEDILKDGRKQYENGLRVLNQRRFKHQLGKDTFFSITSLCFQHCRRRSLIARRWTRWFKWWARAFDLFKRSGQWPAGDNYEYFLQAEGEL